MSGEPAGGGREGLAAYRRKRSADRTPEPFGARAPRPGLFVVQQHAARRLHFDLRLERRGVLWSWAVPKGPSLDPSRKRLAVQVEDHPVDYADFEGRIPEGSYGAGEVIVWDRGRWTPVDDPEAGLAAGKLLFDLEGEKLRGRFTLVRTGGSRRAEGREWLLIKKPDAFARAEGEEEAGAGAPDDDSVLTGLTLAQRRDAPGQEEQLLRAMARAGAARRRVDPAHVRPMLAQRLEAPFSDPGWRFELKIDGYRMIGAASAGRAALRTRNGRTATGRFPEVASALAALPWSHLVVDGEVAVTDREGRPSFQRLQQRARHTRPHDVAWAALESPVTYFVFDLLGFGDLDLRGLPLERRRRFLEALLPGRRGTLRVLESFPEQGEALHRAVSDRGLEGIVAKRADSPYHAGRSPAWRKLRNLESDDLVIVGFTEPAGGRRGFGALHLAWREAGGFVYAGRVGTGFDEALLSALREALDRIGRETPPCGGPVPRTGRHRWVEPRLVCEVRYTEITRDGLLRQPVFVRLRDDKAPEECERPERGGPPPAVDTAQGPGPDGAAAETPREVPLTHQDKVFWPEEGLTKGDLLDYYRAIAPWLLPYLRDRPLVMTRYPDGIGGKSFYQKDAPDWAPAWLRREVVWSEHAEREVHYFVCDDLPSLLYVVNMGTIPLHVWSSRAGALAYPDWCILDLDPKGAPFADVVRVARAIRALCESLSLPTFPKTSGSSGLHVLIPLGATLRYEQSRTLAELLARLVVEELPEIATVTRRVSGREGKVYVDYLQNRHGQLLVAPFSVRPLPGAPVSMPLRWSEVNARLTPRRFTVRNALRRMRRLREDPGRGVLGPAPDLPAVLERLAARRAG